jgi:hypothetical protein
VPIAPKRAPSHLDKEEAFSTLPLDKEALVSAINDSSYPVHSSSPASLRKTLIALAIVSVAVVLSEHSKRSVASSPSPAPDPTAVSIADH